jgi:hypothetical protein
MSHSWALDLFLHAYANVGRIGGRIVTHGIEASNMITEVLLAG